MWFHKAIEEGVDEGVRRGLDATMGDVIDKIILRTLDYVGPRMEQLMRENAALRQEIAELRMRATPETARVSAPAISRDAASKAPKDSK